MKKIILSTLLLLCLSTVSWAQADNRSFRANLINNEYEVYLRINLYDQDITVPGQDLYGELPG